MNDYLNWFRWLSDDFGIEADCTIQSMIEMDESELTVVDARFVAEWNRKEETVDGGCWMEADEIVAAVYWKPMAISLFLSPFFFISVSLFLPF